MSELVTKKVLFLKGFSKSYAEEINFQKIIQLYKDYFKHIAGGAYNLEKEFIVLEEPDLNDLQNAKQKVNDADFLVVVILGHGGSKNGDQVIEFKKDLYISPGSISFNCPKQLHIIESCRNVVNFDIDIKRIDLLVPKYKYGGLVWRSLSKDESRKKFDEEIRTSKDGILYLFSSSIGESSQDLLFIWALVELAANYHTYIRNCVYSIGEIFEVVQEHVSKLSKGSQNPIKQGNVDFPFMIAPIWEPGRI